jgi:hypothetical protein
MVDLNNLRYRQITVPLKSRDRDEASQNAARVLVNAADPFRPAVEMDIFATIR